MAPTLRILVFPLQGDKQTDPALPPKETRLLIKENTKHVGNNCNREHVGKQMQSRQRERELSFDNARLMGLRACPSSPQDKLRLLLTMQKADMNEVDLLTSTEEADR